MTWRTVVLMTEKSQKKVLSCLFWGSGGEVKNMMSLVLDLRNMIFKWLEMWNQE